MNEYTVYFEIYGKKMKVKVKAVSKFEAESQVRKDIKIHKIEDSLLDTFNTIFGDVFKR